MHLLPAKLCTLQCQLSRQLRLKPPGDKDEENRTKLFKRMIEKLKSRSLVDKVFVSKISTAGQPFYERDVNQDSFEGSDGSTVGNRQYMLNINLN